MRALVTGGTGFLGANLVAGLTARGIAVRVLRRPTSRTAALAGLSFETAWGDVLETPATLARAMAGCDWVFHLAAVAAYWRRREADRLYETNVQGTTNVLAAALQAGVRRFVFTSSLAALGVPAPGQRLDESSQFRLEPKRFPYGHAKHLAEIEVRRAVAAGLPAVIVNPAAAIGPRDVNRISGALIFEAARGRLRISPPGALNWVAADDVVAGHIAAAERGAVGERYILAGENLSYRASAAMVCAAVGRPPPVAVLPRWLIPAAAAAVKGARAIWGDRVPLDENQVRLSAAFLCADGSKAVRELSLPQTPFRQAVEAAVRWYRENGELPRR